MIIVLNGETHHKCGAENLVWDFHRGEIICIKCGTVVERIIEYENSSINSSIREGSHPMYTSYNPGVMTKPTKYVDVSSWIKSRERTYKKFRKLLANIKHMGSSKNKNYRINEKAFLYYLKTGKRIKVLEDADSGEKSVKLSNDVKAVLESFVKNDPKLNSRTYRAKLAIALILSELVNKRKSKLTLEELRTISANSGTSLSHVKRMYYFIKKEYYIVKGNNQRR